MPKTQGREGLLLANTEGKRVVAAGAVQHSLLPATALFPGHAAALRALLLARSLPRTANICLQPERSFFFLNLSGISIFSACLILCNREDVGTWWRCCQHEVGAVSAQFAARLCDESGFGDTSCIDSALAYGSAPLVPPPSVGPHLMPPNFGQ